jgi:hypothetical protein
MQQSTLRPAIAMIELIFAIVVMGIALLSVPLMIDTANKSNSIAFQQESIAIIASQANSMMTYAWDERNTQTYSPNRILRVSKGDIELDGNTTVVSEKRTLKNDENATKPGFFGEKIDPEIIGSVIHTESIPDDIDDFHGVDTNLTIAKAGDQISTKGDYLDISIKIHTNVTYLDDTTAHYEKCNGVINSGNCAFSKKSNEWNAVTTGSTNIKLITTTLTSTNVLDKQIILRSFMCNIGAAQPNTGVNLY